MSEIDLVKELILEYQKEDNLYGSHKGKRGKGKVESIEDVIYRIKDQFKIYRSDKREKRKKISDYKTQIKTIDQKRLKLKRKTDEYEKQLRLLVRERKKLQTKERNLEKKIVPRKINNQKMFDEMSDIRVKYRELESEWIEDVEIISGEIENWTKLQSFLDKPKIHFNKDKYGWRGRIKLFGHRFEHRMSKDNIKGIGSSPKGKNYKKWVDKCVPYLWYKIKTYYCLNISNKDQMKYVIRKQTRPR